MGINMRVVGLTGGIASGKTKVAGILKEYFRMKVIYTDEIARMQMMQGGSSYPFVVEEFGREILLSDGEINRAKLASIVFGNETLKLKLNELTHPRVKISVLEEIRELSKCDNYRAVFVETALLIEAGYTEFCDEVWYVHALESERRERLFLSRGFTKDKIENILSGQCTEEEFYRYADHVIKNGNQVTEEEIIRQIQQIIDRWELQWKV